MDFKWDTQEYLRLNFSATGRNLKTRLSFVYFFLIGVANIQRYVLIIASDLFQF